MLQTLKLTLLGLLTLVQAFAPLVHAHAGGHVGGPGYLHVPAFESSQPVAAIEASSGYAADYDWIIALAPASKQNDGLNLTGLDSVLPVASHLFEAEAAAVPGVAARPAFAPARSFHPGAPPRAPPLA